MPDTASSRAPDRDFGFHESFVAAALARV